MKQPSHFVSCNCDDQLRGKFPGSWAMLSVVVPIYNEEENIIAFHAAVKAVMEAMEERWEIVYVNDGSRDGSLSLLLEIQRRDPRVAVLEFSRNFGHQAALTAGLQVAKGDAVMLMDGDFQDPPEVLPRMVKAWKDGAKVVIAERSSRAETGLRGKLFPLFYKVMGLISDFPIPLNAGIFGLLDRQAADAINNLTEGNRYLPGLRAWVGFPTAIVYYERAGRAAGEAKQTLPKLFKYAMDAIFSFSYKPLRLGMVLGGVVLAFTLFLSLVNLGNTVFHLKYFGIIPGAGHIGTLYDEVRRRPLYLVHKLHQSEAEGVLIYKSDKELAEVQDSAA